MSGGTRQITSEEKIKAPDCERCETQLEHEAHLAFESKMRNPPWAIVLQYAQHREVLLTDGAWVNEETPARRPDLSLTPRTFPTEKAAETWLRSARGVDRLAFVSRLSLKHQAVMRSQTKRKRVTGEQKLIEVRAALRSLVELLEPDSGGKRMLVWYSKDEIDKRVRLAKKLLPRSKR